MAKIREEEIIMKEDELRKVAKCSLCGKGIGHTLLPLFWRVRIERWGLNLTSLQRQQGLTMFLGGHSALARVMGPDEDMAKRIMVVELTVCETCAVEYTLPIAALAEKADEEKNDDDGE